MSNAARRWLAAAAACTFLLMIVYVLARRAGAAWWDERILEALSTRLTNYRIHEPADAVREVFDVLPYTILVGLLLAATLRRRLPGAALLAGGMLFAANITTWALQHRLSSPRAVVVLDEPPWLSFWPSGHTTAAVALAIACYLVAARDWRPFVLVAGVPIAAFAAFTNLIVRVHVPSDVVGGVLVACAWGCVALAAQAQWPQLRPDRQRRGPGPPEPPLPLAREPARAPRLLPPAEHARRPG